MRYLLGTLAICLTLIACESETRKEAQEKTAAAQTALDMEAMKTEIIAVHDEVMPKMAYMGRLKNALNTASEGFTGNDEP